MNISVADTDVVIVGAGPAGLIAGQYSRYVRKAGHRLEAMDWPRGVGLDDESFRTIQTVGLVDTVRPHTSPQHIMRLVNGTGKVMLVNNPADTGIRLGAKAFLHSARGRSGSL